MTRISSFLCIAMALVTAQVHAAERHSNGFGGGAWSDPESWRNRIMPAPTDTVVIASGDTIVFDANHTNVSSCAALFMDPQSSLQFKTSDNAAHTMTVAGPIESYGRILLDAARAPQSSFCLVLAAPEASNRVVRLLRNASFMALGAAGLPENARNITLAAAPPLEGDTTTQGQILTKKETILELNRALLTDIHVSCNGIDNTGFKPNERFNLIENRFAGQAHVSIVYADTPVLRRNVFEGNKDKPLPFAAISVNLSKLVQIEANVITGLYDSGIYLINDTESSLTENTAAIPGRRGFYIHGRSIMLKNNIFADCNPAVYFDTATDTTMEDTACDGTGVVFSLLKSSVQITNLKLHDMPETNLAVIAHNTELTLLNTPILPSQINFNQAGAVIAMDYLVAKLAGNPPAGTTIETRTAATGGGPPKDKADLNVRNSPAAVSAGNISPLPASGKALVLKSWSFEPHKKDPPFYELLVLAPPDKPGAPQRAIKSLVIAPKPTWYRPDPNESAPTIEVPLP